MSQQNLGNHPSGAPGPPVPKQQLNVYTMMLIIAFIALCVAIALLFFELSKYGPSPWDTGEATSYLFPSSSSTSVARSIGQLGRAVGLPV